MSILSFPLKKTTTKSSLTVLFRLGDEKRDEPTTWRLKERAKKKRSRIWGICGQISSLTDIFSKRKLVPDVLQKSALTFCYRTPLLDENLVQVTKWCPSYGEFILLLVYSLLFFLIWLYSKLFPEVTSLHQKCNLAIILAGYFWVFKG